MKKIVVASFILMVIAALHGQLPPKKGYVPDEKTATAIAEAVLKPIYGDKKIESEEPFTATLNGDVWTVGGTLRCPDGKGGVTTHCEGGVAVATLSKTDGRILSVMHYK